MRDLVMSAKRATWRMHDHGGEADVEFAEARREALALADKRCHFCELRSDKWQEVHHIDDDHANQAQNNLVCACPLCHQVFHLGLAGMQDGGTLIYAPEFSQVELNALTLAIWLATASNSEFASEAMHVYEDLRNRNFYVTAVFREWAREANVKLQEPFIFTPDLLANGLINMPEAEYANRSELLGGLRLLPRDSRFTSQITHWVSYFGKSIPVAQWHTLTRDLHSALAEVH